MTIKELIDALSKIEDKSLTVFSKVFDEYQDRIIEVHEVHEDEMNYILLT